MESGCCGLQQSWWWREFGRCGITSFFVAIRKWCPRQEKMSAFSSRKIFSVFGNSRSNTLQINAEYSSYSLFWSTAVTSYLKYYLIMTYCIAEKFQRSGRNSRWSKSYSAISSPSLKFSSTHLLESESGCCGLQQSWWWREFGRCGMHFILSAKSNKL